MNSEKVKEIKKALKCCSEGKCEKCLIGKKDIRKCIDILLKDTLTCINELESENERLRKSDTSKEESSIEYYNLYRDFKRENQKLKDRIVELEKKIENGTLVELPCKVGDTAMAIIDTLAYDNSLQRVKIEGLAYIVKDENGDITFQHINRLFSNEAEAEARLKKLQEEQK